MTNILNDFGLETNRQTVGEDIKALGYQLPRPGRQKSKSAGYGAFHHEFECARGKLTLAKTKKN